MKLTEIDIIVNNEYFLYLPADGIDLVLVRNDYNLLTNDIASMRPMYITQQFELPIDKNVDIFKKLKNQDKTFQLVYNRITILTGGIVDYSTDEQKRVMLVSISSRFKDVIDFLGNNILYLDMIDLYDYGMIVPTDWTKNNNNELLRWAYYNPMNTDTGQLAKTDDNIRAYCKPSLHLMNYLRICFKQAGWEFNESQLPQQWQNLVIAPTTKYLVTSFVLSNPTPANSNPVWELEGFSSKKFSWSRGAQKVNISVNGVKSVQVASNGDITLKHPNRLQSFKIKGRVKCDSTFFINLREEGIETPLISWQYLGGGEWESYSQVSDSVNTKEGLNKLYIEFYNPTPDPIKIVATQFLLYNLIPVYETNQDELLNPTGYFYSIADNVPQITALDVYRQLLILFQIAQRADDTTKKIDYYYVNDVFTKSNVVNSKEYVFWNGYESLGDNIEGLARNNVIRYKNDKKRQKAFNINLPQLPSNNVYFESIFAHGEYNNAWGALTIPALNYKVKLVDSVSIEYLEWKDVYPMLANYEEDGSTIGAKLTFSGLSINELTSKYWNNILTFMSSSNLQTPSVFKLKMRVNYYDYINNFGQNNLYLYNNRAVMVRGQYDVLNRELEGTFISYQ